MKVKDQSNIVSSDVPPLALSFPPISANETNTPKGLTVTSRSTRRAGEDVVSDLCIERAPSYVADVTIRRLSERWLSLDTMICLANYSTTAFATLLLLFRRLENGRSRRAEMRQVRVRYELTEP